MDNPLWAYLLIFIELLPILIYKLWSEATGIVIA